VVGPERCAGLLAHLAMPDPRDRRGLRHRLASVLAVAVCVCCAGGSQVSGRDRRVRCRRATGRSGHARHAPGSADRSGACAGRGHGAANPVHYRRRTPSTRRSAADYREWTRAPLRPQVEPPKPPSLGAMAVDDKTLRGSGLAGGQVHLLAVTDHATRVVLGQVHPAGGLLDPAADGQGGEHDGQVRLDRVAQVVVDRSGSQVVFRHSERLLDLDQPVVGADDELRGDRAAVGAGGQGGT
jgi:hypothetical protein